MESGVETAVTGSAKPLTRTVKAVAGVVDVVSSPLPVSAIVHVSCVPRMFDAPEVKTGAVVSTRIALVVVMVAGLPTLSVPVSV